jgi:DNA replication protein DnaC
MEVNNLLPVKDQEEVNPVEDGDYVGEDGLLVCGVCGKRKQYRIQLGAFERIVPCVCKCREKEVEERRRQDEYQEQMRQITRLKDSSMMASKYRDAHFEGYTIREENRKVFNLATNYVENFREMKEKNQGLLLYGPVGTGKSFTAACIANSLLENRVSVIMTSFVKILQDIQQNFNEAEYLRILNGVSLLIIDDLGAERNTDYALEKVYNVVDSRIRTNKPMILTTNLELADMIKCQDIRYKRVYDRIFETCYPVEMPGKSFRQIEAAKRFDRMKSLME